MFKIAKLKIKSTLENKDNQIDSIGYFLGFLYKNGQILKDYILEDHKDFFVATVTTTDDDALESKYNNTYINDALKEIEYEAKIISNAAFFNESCKCKKHSYYIFDPRFAEDISPVFCGDCGLEIPLIHIPYIHKENEHFTIISYQELVRSVETVWIESLSDRFSKKQLTDPNSALNKVGLRICEDLENELKKPVYLFLNNPIGGLFEFEKNNKKLNLCPKCNGEFRYVKKNDFIDKVCDKCRLAFSDPEEKK